MADYDRFGRECNHPSMSVQYADDRNLMLLICDNSLCAKIKAACEHLKMTWHDNGERLLCDYCGADGT